MEEERTWNQAGKRQEILQLKRENRRRRLATSHFSEPAQEDDDTFQKKHRKARAENPSRQDEDIYLSEIKETKKIEYDKIRVEILLSEGKKLGQVISFCGSRIS